MESEESDYRIERSDIKAILLVIIYIYSENLNCQIVELILCVSSTTRSTIIFLAGHACSRNGHISNGD
jgi:hypothetical protein